MAEVQRIKSMASTTRGRQVLTIVVWILYCGAFWKPVAARPLNSIQLATGEWDVSIRGGVWMNPFRIFPPSSPSKDDDDDEVCEITTPLVKRRPWGASMDCILSLASDGTFVLTPKYVETATATTTRTTSSDSPRREEYATTNHDLLPGRTKRERLAKKQHGLLDLRGSWNVLANPYCVTDRYYDQVSLQSYPRQQTTKVPRNEKSDAATKETSSQQPQPQSFQFSLHCRMWGRHHRQHDKRGTYRMTHGTLVCKDRTVPWWKFLGRPVVASFSAVRSSNIPKHQGWMDKEQFGYSAE